VSRNNQPSYAENIHRSKSNETTAEEVAVTMEEMKKMLDL
jgi:hypothetical protein